jgi:hypothetical protein
MKIKVSVAVDTDLPGFKLDRFCEVEISDEEILKLARAIHGQASCQNCGGNINTSSGYRICENGCGGEK